MHRATTEAGHCHSPALPTLLKHSETVSMWGCPSPALPSSWVLLPWQGRQLLQLPGTQDGGKGQGAWGTGLGWEMEQKAVVENR